MGKHRPPPRKPSSNSKPKQQATIYTGIKKNFSSKNGHPPSRENQKGKKKGSHAGGSGELGEVGRGGNLKDIPFGRDDEILLVGEGDFSFSLSLATHHHCRFVTATCLDSEAELATKHPEALSNIARFLALNNTNTKPDPENHLSSTDLDADSDANSNIDSPKPSPSSPTLSPVRLEKSLRIIPSIPASALSSRTRILSRAPYDIVAFNFPHVGGETTDVNRQVRRNQEVVVQVFEAARRLLRTERPKGSKGSLADKGKGKGKGKGKWEGGSEGEEEDEEDADDGKDRVEAVRQGRKGRVILTLFTAPPYTLWNVRDLARHCGFILLKSERFEPDRYPGYRHVRTLGVVKRKDHGKEEEEGEEQESWEGVSADEDGDNHASEDGNVERRSRRSGKGGFWRAEEREARMYIFELKDGTEGSAGIHGTSKPNGHRSSSKDKHLRKR